MQKFIKALAAFQVIEKGADWNTGTDKHQAAAEDIGISVRNIGKCGRLGVPTCGALHIVFNERAGARNIYQFMFSHSV